MIKDIQMELKKIKGLLSDNAGRILQDYARQVEPGHSVVEIGSYTGKSTCYIATALQPGVRMYAIDIWDQLEEEDWWEDLKHGYSDPSTLQAFRENLREFRVSSRVKVVQSDSAAAAKRFRGQPIGMLWLDGDHRYAGVKRDLEAWVPLMEDDTQVLFDDYYYSGVARGLRDVEHELLYKKRIAHSTGKALKEVYG